MVDDDEPYQPKPDPALRFSQDAEPVPIPQMKVPPGELVAGQTINITVKLPKSDTRIYAKLWIRDRQLRVLIESPRWLTDFRARWIRCPESTNYRDVAPRLHGSPV